MNTYSEVAFSPVPRSRLVDAVADQLRDLIMTNDIAPRTKLLQVSLAERLGVSRTPLREALRVLEAEGLVRVSNGNRTVEVVEFTADEIREIYEVREVVDGLAARLAATRGIDDEVDARLEHHRRQMRETSTRRFHAAGFSPAHAAFHATIMQASGNRRLEGMLPVLLMSSQMIIRRMSSADRAENGKLAQAIEIANDDHEQIHSAIQRNSPDEAELLARKHIRRSMRSWLVTDPVPDARYVDVDDGVGHAPPTS